MARVYHFDRAELSQASRPALEALASSDLPAWQRALAALLAGPPPSDCERRGTTVRISSFDGYVDLTPDTIPDRAQLGRALREFALARAKRMCHLREPRIITCLSYQAIDSDDLSDSDAWEYLGLAVFARGAMPPDLWFMDGLDFVDTNWLSAKTISRLLALAEEDGLLQAVQAEHVAVGPDIETVLSECAVAAGRSWELYLFAPGT